MKKKFLHTRPDILGYVWHRHLFNSLPTRHFQSHSTIRHSKMRKTTSRFKCLEFLHSQRLECKPLHVSRTHVYCCAIWILLFLLKNGYARTRACDKSQIRTLIRFLLVRVLFCFVLFLSPFEIRAITKTAVTPCHNHF